MTPIKTVIVKGFAKKQIMEDAKLTTDDQASETFNDGNGYSSTKDDRHTVPYRVTFEFFEEEKNGLSDVAE